MKKVLVTGANGFIGRSLIQALTDGEYEVVAIDIKFDKCLKDNEKVHCIEIKDNNLIELKRRIPNEQYSCLFHLAWVGTSGDIRMDYNVQLDNVRMTCDYVKLCKEIGCSRMIYASSINEMETYEYLQSDNVSPVGGYIYGTGKLAAHLMGETVAKLNDVDFIPIIITNIYGVGEISARMIYTSIRKLLKGEHCSFTDGYQTYDFIYITDAINSIMEIERKGKPFNRYYIGSGEPRPLREFLLDMRDVVAPEIEIGLGDLQFNGADISYEQFDLKKLERDTGYKNKVSFKQGIKLTMDWIMTLE